MQPFKRKSRKRIQNRYIQKAIIPSAFFHSFDKLCLFNNYIHLKFTKKRKICLQERSVRVQETGGTQGTAVGNRRNRSVQHIGR